MVDLANQVQELLDRQAIRDCVYRYARGIDRNDIELVESCYHPDAVDDHGFYVGSGRGVVESAIEAHKDFLKHQHHITNHVVELDGDAAHAETYFYVVMRARSGVTNFVSGRYVDRFERREGEWRIAARVCLTECLVEVPTADMAGIDGTFAPGSPDRSDISYQRPLTVARRSAEEPHPAMASGL